MRAFITSQFSYCPLIWMLQSRTLNNRINNIHERALRLTYKDNKSSFKQLLEKDHSVTVHQKNLQVLVTEIFKVKNNLAPDIMKDVFKLKEPPYNLRWKSNCFTHQSIKTTFFFPLFFLYSWQGIYIMISISTYYTSIFINIEKLIDLNLVNDMYLSFSLLR